MLAESLKTFMEKDEECFDCPYHKDQLAILEVGRQKMARKNLLSGNSQKRDAWITLRDDVHKKAVAYASVYRRSVKVVAEQAVLEYMSRSKCENCPLLKGKISV